MHIHILGICGTFMGGIAALAKAAGHRVTGCDAAVYPPMSTQLQSLGIELIEGYGADQMALKPDVWVVGNVVSRARLANGQAKFPLMEAILDAGAPYISGPQWLAQQILQQSGTQRHVLAVAGTHGKTTTSAMLAWVLEAAGQQPGFLIGGVPLNFNTSARLGNCQADSTFVIEADEYDTAFFDKRSKFVHYRPKTLIINNLEYDHADIFASIADIERQFHHLVRTVPGSGLIVHQAGVAAIERVLAQGCWSNTVGFGGSQTKAAWQLDGAADDFAVLFNGAEVGRINWQLTGVHNQLNALACVAAAEHVGISAAQACAALSEFKNAKRRMELKASVVLRPDTAAVQIYDDFAHHPTAIALTLEGLRLQLQQQGNSGRIFAIFEPRSNTMKLGSMRAQLPAALQAADMVFCHSAGLDWDVAASLQNIKQPTVVNNDINQLVQAIVAQVQPGDQLLCMSNGSFANIHSLLEQQLATKFKDRI